MNQGQAGHPSTDDVLQAFEVSGAREPWTFQSNGTVVFDSDDPDAVVDGAVLAVAARSGVEREAFWISFPELERVVAVHESAPDAVRRELTLHGGGLIDLSSDRVVREAAHRGCVMVDAGHGWVVSANERDRESNATPVVERLTGGLASSRGIPTLRRLVDRA